MTTERNCHAVPENLFRDVTWLTGRDLAFTQDGKHDLSFDSAFPLQLNCYDFSPYFHVTPNYHDYLEIVFVLQGEGSISVKSNTYPLTPGDMLLLNNREFHVVDAGPRQVFRLACLHFLPEIVSGPTMSASNLDYLAAFFRRSKAFANRIPASSECSGSSFSQLKKIHRELRAGSPFHRLAVGNALREILLLVNRYYGDVIAVHKRKLESSDLERLNPLFEYVRTNHDRRLSVDELAGVACMSSGYLSRFFRKVTGMTLMDYLARYRIDKAKELLVDRHLTISQVAYEVGFESLSNFDRTFGKLVGMSPGEFRDLDQ